MERTGERPVDWPVVLTVHGIRTTGDWQRELTDVLTQHGFRHVPLGFGFFKAVSLLMPWSRARKIEWFRRVYSEKFATSECLPSVIAHSFGSYIVTKAMLKYDDIRFDRMILCGSIVSRKYPWTRILIQRGQVSEVLNEAGGRDFWAAVVEWVVSDAGSSGVVGFDDLANGGVLQLIHERHEHSDYFYRQNFEKRWVPFLRGAGAKNVIPVGDEGVNRKFAITISTLILLLFAAGFLVLGKVPKLPWLEGAGAHDRAVTALPDPSRTDQEIPELKTDQAASVLAASSDVLGNAVREWSAHLHGVWVQAGDLPQVVDDGLSNRCIKSPNTQTAIAFGSFDEAEGIVWAKWQQHSISTNRLQPLRGGPQPYDLAIRERIDCLGENSGHVATRVQVEAGRFSIVVKAGLDKPAEAKLTIEECGLDGQDCPASMFGDRSMPLLEAIGEDRLRLGELMFIRQESPSQVDPLSKLIKPATP